MTRQRRPRPRHPAPPAPTAPGAPACAPAPPPPTPAPEPPASPAPAAPTGTSTPGWEISRANTGWQARPDADLGRILTPADLTDVVGPARPSDLAEPGGTISRRRFLSDVGIDIPVTFENCEFNGFVTTYVSGHETSVPSQFNWCTFNSTGADISIGSADFSLYRCNLRGGSDALRINGGQTGQRITECYARVSMKDARDHNDTAQNYQGDGRVVIERCNLSVGPEGGLIDGGRSGGPNAVVMSADMGPATTYRLELVDNLIDGDGSAYAVRFYDGALTPNITYLATGNRFVRGASRPIDRGAANTTPLDQIVWERNVWADTLAPIDLG